jgi:hypothetical protein
MPELNTETLMAFVDGELLPEQAAAVEAALAHDAGARQQVERMQALNRRLRAAFSTELSDAVPAGLMAHAHGQHLNTSQERHTPAAQGAQLIRFPRGAWPRWMGLAASVLLLLWGWQAWGPGAATEDIAWRNGPDGRLVASASLERALEQQLALETGTSPIKVAWTFKDRDGRYCRSFEAPGGAGLACRDAGHWQLVVLTPTNAPTNTPTTTPDSAPAAEAGLRLASSGLPTTVLEAAERRMAGMALDARQEREARDAGWRR